MNDRGQIVFDRRVAATDDTFEIFSNDQGTVIRITEDEERRDIHPAINNLDIPVIMAALRGNVRFLAKKAHFRFPLFGWTLGRYGHIPIDREPLRGAVRRGKQPARWNGHWQGSSESRRHWRFFPRARALWTAPQVGS